MMKLFILLSATCALALASHPNDPQGSNNLKQNIRFNNQINPSTSSSESDEQPQNILKTKIFNLKRCHLSPEPTSDEINQFHKWAQEHNKRYFTEHQKLCKMINVVSKIRDIYAHNRRFNEGKETFTRKLNNMSDLSKKEIKIRLFMKNFFDWNRPESPSEMLQDFPQPRPSVDYRDEKLVGPVGQQGKCGSCWAWSGAAVLEGQLRKCGISQETVSAQNILDCASKSVDGCNGGNPIDVFNYGKTGGIVINSKYPYVGKQNRCTFNRSDIIGYVDQPFRYAFLEIPQVELFMRKIVSSVGPISTIMHANQDFVDYDSGVFKSSDCNNKLPNHAVTIVGYGTDPKFGNYWLLKNSWGTSWGENGYGRIARGNNMCLFESRVYYAQITDKNRNVCSLE